MTRLETHIQRLRAALFAAWSHAPIVPQALEEAAGLYQSLELETSTRTADEVMADIRIEWSQSRLQGER